MNRYYRPTMLDILRPGKMNSVQLIARTIPVDTFIRSYSPNEGRIFYVRFATDYLTIVLFEGERLWMSDTPFEYEGIRRHLKDSKGQVLTSGLGLGLFAYLASKRKAVKQVDVVEINQDIIELVGKQLRGRKIHIIQDDIYHYLSTTVKKYDFIYLDIWADFIGPIKDVDKAAKVAKRCLKPGGEVKVWLQELIDRVKKKLPKKPVLPGGAAVHEPCLICGKTYRNDYGGVCMDCADDLGVSELYIKSKEVSE